MDRENAIFVEQRLRQSDIVLVGRPSAQPERGDRAVQVVRREDLDLGQILHRVDPAIAERAQPGGAGRGADRRLELERRGHGQLRRIVRRPGVHARDDAGRLPLFGGVGVDRVDPVRRMYSAPTPSGAPIHLWRLMPMKSALRSGNLKSSWPTLWAESTSASMPRARASSTSLGDRQHQSGAVAEVGQQHHLDRRIGVERASIGVDQRLAARRLGKRDLDHPHAASRGKRFHAVLHAVVIEVGVEHGVAGLETIVLEDQRLHRLGGVAGEGDLVDRDAHCVRHGGTRGFYIADHRPPRIIARVAVHALDMSAVCGEHRLRHHPPIAVLELDDLAGHVIFAGDPVPVVGRRSGGDGGGSEGKGSGAEHRPAINLHAPFVGQTRR